MFTKEEYNSIKRIVDEMISSRGEKRNIYGFDITKFNSPHFLTDYKCYKVESGEKVIVVKYTHESEYQILQVLKNDGFPVPQILHYIMDREDVFIFEEYLKGIELGPESSKDAWINTAVQLAEMHMKYWGQTGEESIFLDGNISYSKKFRYSVHNQFVRDRWPILREKIIERFEKAPTTLLHGDTFPTNFLIENDRVSMVDFERAAFMPYMIDIARLTCLPMLDGEPFCESKKDVLKAYYDQIQSKLTLSEEEYMIDVKMASFVELASSLQYHPVTGLPARPYKVNDVTIDLLENLANELTVDLKLN